MTANHQTPAPRMPAWVLLLGAAALVVLVVWGVSMWAGRTTEMGFATGEPISVEGCLTSAEGSDVFVLTPTDLNPLGGALARSATDVRPTFTYQLVGRTSQLRPHVGERVSITGVVEESVVAEAEVERERATPPAAPDMGDAPEDATVRTSHEAEIEQRRMQVRTVEVTGESCPAGSLSGNIAPGADTP